MHNEKLTLATLCGGAVQEKFNRALERVGRNILDPNVVPDKKRTVTLKVTFKPTDYNQEDVVVSADVSYTLSPELGVTTQMYVSRDIEKDSISIMEHQRGEIRGQLDFSDIGLEHADDEEEDFDPETGEIKENVTANEVLDFRKAK